MIIMVSCLIISLAILFISSYLISEELYNKYFTIFFMLDAAAYIMLVISGAFVIGPWLLEMGYYV